MRRRVRLWTKLPHDATNSYIHADVKNGGLGVPSLRYTIPFMKRSRLKRLAASVDTMISHLVGHSAMFARECANCTRPPVRVGSTIVNSVVEAKLELARQLHSSADGCGLQASVAVPFFPFLGL